MAKRATLADMLNDMTFRTIYDRLHNLAVNMFEWEGLPEGMREEHIERVLYTQGKALFFKDANNGLLCLPCTSENNVNIYNEPVNYRAVGYGYNVKYAADKCVLIRNNKLQTNTHDYIMLYTNKLTEIERSLDANVKAQKFPYIIACDDKSLLTVKNVYKQISSNEPAIFPDKNFDMDSIRILETVAPLVTSELADYRHDVTNEVLSFLGINNANTDKRERLIADEVNANNEYIERNVEYMLAAREKACKEINLMFGCEMSVKLRETEKGGES
jgi:hypothetical protein